MIRPDMVSLASQMVSDANLQIGTVRFSRRKFNFADKLFEAKRSNSGWSEFGLCL
jgi:hypothetical protein